MNRSTIVTLAIAALVAVPLVWAGDAADALEARFLETKARAEAGEVDAQYQLAGMFAGGKGTTRNDAEAVKWYRIVAGKSDPRGQSMLGVMYTNARGVEQDYEQAIGWFRKAAAQNSAHAKYNLGYMYSVGKGVPLDQTQATDWYRQAAELNDAGSQRILGSRYADGLGVDKDLVRAHAWTQVGVPRGGAAAEEQLKAIESRMTPEQIVAANKLAKEISERLAKPAPK